MTLCVTTRIALLASLLAAAAAAQPERNFSGTWKLDSARSEMDMAVPADPFFSVEQTGTTLRITAPSQDGSTSTVSVYPLDGHTEKYQTGVLKKNTQTKWEGAALIVTTIVSGPQDFSIMERWRRSNDGNRLTITRTVVRKTGESEATLAYDNGQAPAPVLRTAVPVPTQSVALQPQLLVRAPVQMDPGNTDEYVLPGGTRILLRLTNAVNTKRTAVGNHVYLQTAFPVFINGRLIVPQGSYVDGVVTEAKKAGRVKGTAALSLQFNSLTLPNGVLRDLRSRPGSVDTNGDLNQAEGRIKGDSTKGADAGKVAQTTAGGAGLGAIIGSAAGHVGMGAGIGAAAGGLAGLGGILGSRGADVILPQGTTMELVVDHDLHFTSEDLRPRIQ